MIREDDIQMGEIQTNFDFKGFLFKLLSYWPFFLFCLGVAISIAYYINVRKLPVYQIQNMISINDDQNPFFTTNTSLTFNWGGTTDKVNTAMITLKSRSHNEQVVERTKFYMNYKKDGKYKRVDAYGQTPFKVLPDSTKPQMLNKSLIITFKDSVTFDLETNFPNPFVGTQNFDTKRKGRAKVPVGDFKQEFKLGEKIELPFFSATLIPDDTNPKQIGRPFYVNFSNFDGVVKRYLGIAVQSANKGASVITLKLNGQNKNALVDYLNTSVQVLSDNMLDRKNLFAKKTIDFIDSTLQTQSKELKDVENELNTFKNNSGVLDLSSEGRRINERLNGLDLRRKALQREIDYYNTLQDYLLNKTDYRDLPAPSVAGINEQSIVSGVGRIIA